MKIISEQEDIVWTKLATNFDYHEIIKKNNLPSGAEAADMYEYITRSFVVANRTVISKILYTADSSDMVLINVPPILRPNSHQEHCISLSR